MSDRKKLHNTDNKNTNTIYVPKEARARYEQQRRQRQQPAQQNPPQQYQNQPQQYQNQPQQYQNPPQQYQNPPQQYQNPPQQYQNQPQQYQNQPQQYQNPPYNQPNIMAQPYVNGYGQQYQQYQQQPQYPNQPYQQQYQQPQYQPPRQAPPPKKRPAQHKKKKKKSGTFSKLLLRMLAIILIIFLLFFGIYSCTALSLIKKMHHADTGYRERTSAAMSASYVRSVLLIGTDGRSLNDRGRSDTMILMSLNSATDQITLTSFMRDCYVEIPNYGWDKLNSAYSYGGADLLMDTIEHNFGVKIDDYVCVNFISFANIVDAVGGIELDVSYDEAMEINTIMQAEVNSIMGDDTFADMLQGGGKLHLNGKQALSYARIRYVGNSDFERTERQRRVIELLMNKLKKMNPLTLSNISTSVLPDVVTNMSTAELYLLSLRAPLLLGYERQQIQVPIDGTFDYYNDSPVGAVLNVDLEANYNELKRKVFNNA